MDSETFFLKKITAVLTCSSTPGCTHALERGTVIIFRQPHIMVLRDLCLPASMRIASSLNIDKAQTRRDCRPRKTWRQESASSCRSLSFPRFPPVLSSPATIMRQKDKGKLLYLSSFCFLDSAPVFLALSFVMPLLKLCCLSQHGDPQ